ncbi:MAG: winged helix-turn-helix domain-containing protein [Nitrospirae bacterium]|nr:winged helix-turn-helix domain-containing protein [Nitrospirota bacterium]MCL5063264.1 winged helix-turn-helix domain-containing protein [Nitrospirota bacterium]MDA8214036.1 winged helix-turn-helix domain-containing protein [Nitrospiraceae bacterium]MDA8337908.1 winged helix-turn-helix domain-containing protein [Nitrospiraceae bacterium]
MLKSLFSSSVRADVLALLLNSPEERFYVREIAKLLRKNPSGVKRELDKLEEMGLVFSEKVANLKYFQADRNSPLFSELKDLIAKSLGLPGALKSLLRANDIKSAFIYGPYAEGEDTPTVDLIVIGSFTPALLIGLHDIEKNFGKRINCTVIEEAEYKLKKRKDASVKRILAEKRITLLGRI